jgi:peptide/nickel transport system substrate-binding protein
MNIAVPALPAGLEPAQEMGNPGTRITYSVFDTLLRRDFLGTPDGGGSQLKPHLATSWERKSPTELLITLRPGVKFHNGDELTSDDIAYTFRNGRLWGDKPEIVEGRSYFGTLAACEAIDKYTVRFKTAVPDLLLEQRLASWASWIVNKRHYEKVGLNGFNRDPIGTGPYRFKSMRSGDSIEFVAHDEYFLGRPTARSVAFREIKELAARVSGLVSGEFDLITNIPPDQASVLGQYADIDQRNVVLANAHVLTFDERSPMTSDHRIRKALALSIDRQKLVDSLWLGKAVVPNSHNYPEFNELYLSEPRKIYDIDRARSLLKDAGYKGEEITYRTMPAYYTNALDAAQIIVEMWKSIGINAKLQVVENFDQMRSPGQQVGNNSNSTRLPDPLGALWISWGPPTVFQRSKAWTYRVDEFNKLGRSLETETETATRKQLWGQMLDVWEDACPGTVLYQPLEIYGVKKSIKWRPTTFYFMDLRPDNLTFS